MDVLIAGAGPTGLALACGLRRAGVRVRIVDRAEGPATTSRALGLHLRGMEVLDRLGALGDLRAHAIQVRGGTVHAGTRELLSFDLAGPSGTDGPLMISQAEIEARLRERLGELGGHVDWGTEVTGAVEDADGLTVTLDPGNSTRTGWLVGCDGAHSRVRKLPGIGFPGARITERFLLADVHLASVHDHDRTASWTSRDGMFVMFPLPEGLWRLMADLPLAEDDEPTPEALLDHLRRAAADRAGLDLRIADATWTSTFRIHRRLAEDYRRGRILLAGDAAHIHSPLGGQGMNTGIGDAENLAWKLALVVQGRADGPLLDTYRAERRPVAAGVLSGTTLITRLALATNPVVRLLREQVAPIVLDRPWVRARVTARASQLRVTYRSGPLGGVPSVADRWRGTPRPGDRIPDLACHDEQGEPTRLYRRLAGWALLVPAGLARDAVAVARKRLPDLVVLEPDQRAVLGRPGGVLLVRPDGHLAWRGDERPAKLARWLEDALNLGRTR